MGVLTLSSQKSGALADVETYGSLVKLVSGTFVFSNAYTTGGEALDLAPFLGDVDGFIASPASGYVFEYDAVNKKLKAYYADYAAVAAGALIEVPATTNLSAVTATFLAWGR